MNNKTLIQIEENETTNDLDVDIDLEDLEYLEKKFLKDSKKFSIFKNPKTNKLRIKNTSYVGLIELKNCRLNFKPKVGANFYYMLNYLKNLEDKERILPDLDRIIFVDQGINFYEFMGMIFNSQLNQIIKKGLLKKYEIRKENIRFIKGKINVNENIKKNYLNKNKIFCEYNELTFNNIENKIVFAALTILIKRIKNNKLKNRLNNNLLILSDVIDLEYPSSIDFKNISYNRMNDHYKIILKLSEHIILRSYIGDYKKQNHIGFNFIVNMVYVYQDFITEIIKELINSKYPGYVVKTQQNITNLEKNGKLMLKPDIILTNKTTNKTMVIDAKYKMEDINADYYQILSYLLSYGNNGEKGLLLYPKSSGEKNEKLLFKRSFSSEDYDLPINCHDIDLDYDINLNDPDDFLKFKKTISDRIETLLFTSSQIHEQELIQQQAQ